MTAPPESADMPRAACWCCGAEYADDQLLHLGARPEAAVCVGCATHLHRRAQRARDAASGPTVAGVVRGMVGRARDLVIRTGMHNWPVIGIVLRRVDRHLP